jgi:hypothetical protein
VNKTCTARRRSRKCYMICKKDNRISLLFLWCASTDIVVKKAMATLHSSNTLSNNDRWKATSPADWVIWHWNRNTKSNITYFGLRRTVCFRLSQLMRESDLFQDNFTVVLLATSIPTTYFTSPTFHQSLPLPHCTICPIPALPSHLPYNNGFRSVFWTQFVKK